MGGVAKVRGFFKKKGLRRGGVLRIFILTDPFQCYLSLSAWCSYVCFVHYTISISILPVSLEELIV